jgi:DNA helicase-2/ATP-dependent DNA helicase PcrA
VAAEVERLVRLGTPPDRIGVLVRSVRHEGQAVAVALEERAVPHRLVGAAAFFQRAEVRDVLAWLRLLVDPSDAGAVVRALARPPIELRSADLARCIQIARRRKLDMVSALAAATESPQLPPEARERILGFLKLHRQAAAALDSSRPDLFVHRLIERLGLRRQGLFAAQADAVERLLGLARIGELAARHVRRSPQATPREFARHLAAVADAGLREEETDAGADATGPAEDMVSVVAMHGARGQDFDHVFVLGLQSARMPGARSSLVEPVPDELLDGELPPDGREAHVAHMRRLLRAAMTRSRRGLVLAYAAAGGDGARQNPSPMAEEARLAVGGTWEDRDEELFGPDEALHAMYATLREELLRSVPAVGHALGELRFDTDLDVSHGVTRYLEMVKVAALLERPAGQSVAEALVDVNTRLLQAASSSQREALETSNLDAVLLGAERDAAARAAALAAREEPSLEPFLPKRGDGLMLSASDIETYRTCPLKYKFARVFRIPSEPTMNQRFGILVHQVLERFHQTGAAGAGRRARRRGAGRAARAARRGLAARRLRRHGGGAPVPGEGRRGARPLPRALHVRPRGARLAREGLPVQARARTSCAAASTGSTGCPTGATSSSTTRRGARGRSRSCARTSSSRSTPWRPREAWQLESSREAYLYVLDDEKVRVPAEEIDEGWITDTVMEVADGILGQGFEPTPSYAACSMCDFRIACPAAER